eukprot:SAG31_NODE_31709_length_365_cov_0.695489_1_plen_71_part_10
MHSTKVPALAKPKRLRRPKLKHQRALIAPQKGTNTDAICPGELAPLQPATGSLPPLPHTLENELSAPPVSM